MFGLSNDISCALVGGAIMASATSLNLLLCGKITGMSSLLSSVLGGKPDFRWKLSSMVGIMTGALVGFQYLGGRTGSLDLFGERLSVQMFDSSLLPATNVLLGGLLVGYGVRLGSGCTSGHGLCGLPRLSKRSIAAVSVFMSVGLATATLLDKHPLIPKIDVIETFASSLYINLSQHTPVVLTVINLVMALVWVQKTREIKEFIASYLVGILFSAGLFISGMTQVSKILSFLTFNNSWNPNLMFTMASGVGINLLTFNLILKRNQPVLTSAFLIPPKGDIDGRLIAGAAVFGLGWGISGACPGPAMALATITNNGLFSLGSVSLGMILYELLQGEFKLKGS